MLWHTPFEIGIGDHVQQMFGHKSSEIIVLQALLLHLHVYMYKPREDRSYWTLMTMGLSGYDKMKVPERVRHPKKFRRYELMIYLSPEWDPVPGFQMGPINEVNWPLYMLKSLATYSVEHEAWLSMWHGIPSVVDGRIGAPFLPNSLLNSTLLVPPVTERQGFTPYRDAETGEVVNFWVVVPMTDDEWKLKRDEQAGALIPFLENGTLPLICQIDRKSCLQGNPADLRIPVAKDAFLNTYE